LALTTTITMAGSNMNQIFTDIGLELVNRIDRHRVKIQYFAIVYIHIDCYTGSPKLYRAVVDHLIGEGFIQIGHGVWIGDCGVTRVRTALRRNRLHLIRCGWFDRGMEMPTAGRQREAWDYLHDPARHYSPSSTRIVWNAINNAAWQIEAKFIGTTELTSFPGHSDECSRTV
jgi:hypothetical protein